MSIRIQVNKRSLTIKDQVFRGFTDNDEDDFEKILREQRNLRKTLNLSQNPPIHFIRCTFVPQGTTIDLERAPFDDGLTFTECEIDTNDLAHLPWGRIDFPENAKYVRNNFFQFKTPGITSDYPLTMIFDQRRTFIRTGCRRFASAREALEHWAPKYAREWTVRTPYWGEERRKALKAAMREVTIARKIWKVAK